MPTVRADHGLTACGDRFFVMGGEAGVIANGQITRAKSLRTDGLVRSEEENLDPARAEAYVRHAVGAATIGDPIHVAGGGAVIGGPVHPWSARPPTCHEPVAVPGTDGAPECSRSGALP